ncbi:helix-turn-helix domain-containing protein [Streptomyces sp. NPDC051665]|uniref:TetR/AcrR family transcriptional regulator n=1 Tax=Streptomyces sp. NPDC051665 TaxID=3154647 RepID=UPI003447F400
MAELAEPGRPPLRRDAELNRRRLMTAAREVFRDRGLAATLDDVARHAGLGVGTAYRHFSNKEELVDAVFEDMIDQVEASAREAAADPDPWHGLASSLEKVCELQAHDRGLREVMLGTGKAAQRHALVDRRIKPLVDPLIARAKEQGALRPDVENLDLPMIQLMVAAVTDQTGEPELWRRYLRLLLDGMRTQPDGTEPLPPALVFRGIGVAADTAGEKPPRL